MKLKKPATIHFVYLDSNQPTNPPVIIAGEVAMCGQHRWVTGTKDKRVVTCSRCIKILKEKQCICTAMKEGTDG